MRKCPRQAGELCGLKHIPPSWGENLVVQADGKCVGHAGQEIADVFGGGPVLQGARPVVLVKTIYVFHKVLPQMLDHPFGLVELLVNILVVEQNGGRTSEVEQHFARRWAIVSLLRLPAFQ